MNMESTKEALKTTNRKLRSKKYFYLWMIPLMFGIFFGWGKVIHYVDPTSGQFGFSIFETPIVAIIYVTLFLWTSIILVNFALRTFFDFYLDIRNKFEELTTWQKFIIVFSSLFILFWALNYQSGKIMGSADAALSVLQNLNLK